MSKPFWRTSLSSVEPNKILIRGYRVEDLMERCSFGDVIYLTFKGELPAGNEGKLIEMIMVSSTDHSFLAPSIDATRFVASGGVPLQAAVAAGVISLGDHHGGAIEQCARMLQESVPAARPGKEIVAEYRERKQRVPGFGHPWHDHDPRTRTLFAKAKEWKLAGPHLALVESISSELKLPANIDGAISGIISDMGIAWQYGRAFFILPRTVGLAAHAVEEVTRERPFRALDISDIAYDGPPERDLPK
ncbi:MAG TPA: citryl-CoA lyase [Terriglobia bacterium]|nr:citryl-CoA lyase [Terriglobia bacterium]